MSFVTFGTLTGNRANTFRNLCEIGKVAELVWGRKNLIGDGEKSICMLIEAYG